MPGTMQIKCMLYGVDSWMVDLHITFIPKSPDTHQGRQAMRRLMVAKASSRQRKLLFLRSKKLNKGVGSVSDSYMI